MAAGEACWIPSAETFNAMGLDWNAIRTISDADLNRIPKSPLLLKGTGPEVYLVEGASRQRIPTADIFAAMGLDLGAILEIGNAQLRAIPEGAPIDRPRRPIPPPPQNVTIGGGPAPAPAPVAQAAVIVRFHNPGLAVMDIYSVAPDGTERRWGGIAPDSATIPIPTRAGELWRFRLSPTARSNNSVRDEYRATAEPEQRHAVPGFLNNAEDPSPSVISQVLAELVRNVEARRQEAGRVIDSLGSPRLPTNCGPGTDNQAGVCYPACPLAGRTGVGPMCWTQLAAADVNRIVNDLRTKANSLAGTYRRDRRGPRALADAVGQHTEPDAHGEGCLRAWRPAHGGAAAAGRPARRGHPRATPGGARARRGSGVALPTRRLAWRDCTAVGGCQGAAGGPGQRRTIHRLVCSAGPRFYHSSPAVLTKRAWAGRSTARAHGDPTGRTRPGAGRPDFRPAPTTRLTSASSSAVVPTSMARRTAYTFGGAAGVGGTITFWFSHRGNFSGLTLTPSTGVCGRSRVRPVNDECSASR